MRRQKWIASVLFCVAWLGCADRSWKVTQLESPAGMNSGEPHLVSANGEIWMSWLEKSGSDYALKFSRWTEDWSPPQVIASGLPFFVNWADFPSILPLANGSIVAHWLEKKGEGAYAYFVMTSLSADKGKTWSRPFPVHTDTSANEHGFASLIDQGDGGYSVTWLDSRKFQQGEHNPQNEMSLMFATVRPDGSRNELTLDPRVCDCCQTAAVRTPDGLFIAYRDRSPDEVRDISYVRYAQENWSAPKPVHTDGWRIEGCPVNGPAVDAAGNTVVVAWYTGAKGQGRVNLAFSENSGESFGPPIQVDDGNPSGRVDVVLLEDGRSAIVSWLENLKEQGAAIRLKQVFNDGTIGKTLTVADTSQARASGFPRLARVGDELLIGWTYAGEQSQVRVARIKM